VIDLNRADYDFLRANGRLGAASGHYFAHLDQPIGVWNYIRIANSIARQIPTGDLLDWGCGYGQMTYLLQRRGFRVTPYDLGTSDTAMPDIPLCHGLNIVRTTHSTQLPFDDASFDAVLGSGVLEHVDEHSEPGNERKSLRELARIIRPGGHLLIYQLPQRYAWQEAVIRTWKLGYAHPRRYTVAEITAMLAQAGFSVRHVARANLVPKNLTGMPARLRALYSSFSRPLIMADRILCSIPLLNQLAGVLELTAQRNIDR
jgi:2-polyprenyl-3-methyl-5-hydroxy-6-metoxy-1,4-benzoquinol methylase